MTVAAAPDLRYVTDAEPGFRRRRAGRHFRYVDERGAPVRDRATLDRIRALAIPPAWTDVWICRSPNGHLQATGRDARDRKQYRYHVGWRAFRDRLKFARLDEFGSALPTLRRAVANDLGEKTLTRDKVIATVVWLLEETLVRVGNEEYARTNDSYGLTTLRNRHARSASSASEVRLLFRGKNGKRHEVTIEDRRIVRVVRQCQELPGQLLFEYWDDDGSSHPVHSGDVNDYLRAAMGMDVTAKDFRTWAASVLAASMLGRLPPPADEGEARQSIAEMTRFVSEQLRNTPAVSRNSYIHPLIIDEYEQGTLSEKWESAPIRGPRALTRDERRLLALLKHRRRRARVTDAARAA